MAKNPKLAIIILLSVLLLLGLSTIVILSIVGSSGDKLDIVTGAYVRETNESVATRFAQTSTQLASTPNEITKQPNATATPPSDVELVPIPLTHLDPTTSPN